MRVDQAADPRPQVDKAFLFRQQGSLVRIFRIDAYFSRGDKIQFVLDASPWGLGGILKINNEPKSWYASPLSSHDVLMFKCKIGDPEGQQTWESLNVLVALRIWRAHWLGVRAVLEVKADNVTALSMLAKLKGSTPNLNVIAREMALDIGDSAYRPQVITHCPGIAIKAADALSRKFQPKSSKDNKDVTLHTSLHGIREVVPPVRDPKFYMSLNPPSSHLVLQGAQAGLKGGVCQRSNVYAKLADKK